MLVSAVTTWEIVIKHAAGRLPLPQSPAKYIPDFLRSIGAQPLAIEHGHALAVTELEPLHRDPFDRMLVAQAIALDVPILTADRTLARYPVETLLI